MPASKTLGAIMLLNLASVWAQTQWTPCPVYCYPRTSQSQYDLQVAGCPPPSVFVSTSETYYTPTCSCYDYQITDGSWWSGCSACVSPGPNNTYENTCEAAQPKPDAPASCKSKNDDISNACSMSGGVTSTLNFLCDLDSGLSKKAKGVFAGLKLLETGLARGALTLVDTGCRAYQSSKNYAEDLVDSGCDVWNNIGGCQEDTEAAATGGAGHSSTGTQAVSASSATTITFMMCLSAVAAFVL